MTCSFVSILRPVISPACYPLGPGSPQANGREGPELAHVRNGKLFQVTLLLLHFVGFVCFGQYQKTTQTGDLHEKQQLFQHRAKQQWFWKNHSRQLYRRFDSVDVVVYQRCYRYHCQWPAG